MIQPIVCPQCGHTGFPGEEGMSGIIDDGTLTIACKCGNKFPVPWNRDQYILSKHLMNRIMAACNGIEWGTVEITPGVIENVTFEIPFATIGIVELTPNCTYPLHVNEVLVNPERMMIGSSAFDAKHATSERIRINYVVYGLHSQIDVPAWFQQFFAAIVNTRKMLYKPALIDYATAFEMFVELHLQRKLTQKYDESVATFLLDKNPKIETRVKDVLELATGVKMPSNDEIYQPWHVRVQRMRNKLAHGEILSIGHDDVEQAHQAVYRAMKWIHGQIYNENADVLEFLNPPNGQD